MKEREFEERENRRKDAEERARREDREREAARAGAAKVAPTSSRSFTPPFTQETRGTAESMESGRYDNAARYPMQSSVDRWNTSAKVAPTSSRPFTPLEARGTAESLESGRYDNAARHQSPLATDTRARSPVTSPTDTWRTDSPQSRGVPVATLPPKDNRLGFARPPTETRSYGDYIGNGTSGRAYGAATSRPAPDVVSIATPRSVTPTRDGRTPSPNAPTASSSSALGGRAELMLAKLRAVEEALDKVHTSVQRSRPTTPRKG